MKLLWYTDPHWAQNSSIIVGSSNSTSGRLDALIKSYEWLYQLAKDEKVDLSVNGGDTFDKSTVQANEHTALTEGLSYRDPSVPEIGLVGNHDMLSHDGVISAVSFMNLLPNYTMYSSPDVLEYHDFENAITHLLAVLPYKKYSEDELQSFYKLVDHKKSTVLNDTSFELGKTILLSHNDIYGSDLGGWSMKSGINPDDLVKHFDLTLNGHIHNGSWVVKDKVLNVGSLSGQNFSSKFVNWQPSVIIYDTDTGKVTFYENPHALRFITITANSLAEVLSQLNSISDDHSYGLSIKVPSNIIEEVRSHLDTKTNIINSRIQEKFEISSTSGDLVNIEKYDNVEGGYSTLLEYLEQVELPTNIDKTDLMKVVSTLKRGEEL